MSDEHDEMKDEIVSLRRLVLALAKRLDADDGHVIVGRSAWYGIFAGLALPQLIADADADDTVAQVCDSAVDFAEALVERIEARYGDGDADID